MIRSRTSWSKILILLAMLDSIAPLSAFQSAAQPAELQAERPAPPGQVTLFF